MTDSIDALDDFFNSYAPNFGGGKLRENRLKRMHLLLARLGNPEKSFKSFHIAGSKGKGTTATCLASMIEKSGARCGLYMSPHVYDIRERFSHGSVFFSEEEYISTLEELKGKIKGFSLPPHLGPEMPTTFELYTAYGYLLFKNCNCKYAVIETGLGGRLDATNTLIPEAAIFTNIELEHTNVLGNTFEEIAEEKLGIIQKGIKCFYYQDALKPLIEKKASESNAELIKVDLEFDEKDIKNAGGIYTLQHNGYKLHLSNPSTILIKDAIYAANIYRYFFGDKEKEYDLTDINLPARFERRMLKNGTTIVIDGAHTISSCKEALDSFSSIVKSKKPYSYPLIFSIAQEKQLEAIANEVFPCFKNIFITGLGEFKKSNPEEITDLARKINKDGNIQLSLDTTDILSKALEKNPEYILVLGSFYLADEINRAIKELGNGY